MTADDTVPMPCKIYPDCAHECRWPNCVDERGAPDDVGSVVADPAPGRD